MTHRLPKDKSWYILDVHFTFKNILICRTNFMVIVPKAQLPPIQDMSSYKFWTSRNKCCNVGKYEGISEHHLFKLTIIRFCLLRQWVLTTPCLYNLHIVDHSHTYIHTYQSHIHTNTMS